MVMTLSSCSHTDYQPSESSCSCSDNDPDEHWHRINHCSDASQHHGTKDCADNCENEYWVHCTPCHLYIVPNNCDLKLPLCLCPTRFRLRPQPPRACTSGDGIGTVRFSTSSLVKRGCVLPVIVWTVCVGLAQAVT